MSDDLMERLSKPGDGDLVIDAEGLVLDAWTRVEGDVMISLSGGHGWWWSADEPDVSCDLADIEAQITASLRSATPEHLAYFDEHLHRWSQSATPLRLCWARGRLGCLIAAGNDWLPFPFNPYPEDCGVDR
jgi:hypothetical protein